MAKPKSKKPRAVKVPEASMADVFDDPGPTRMLSSDTSDDDGDVFGSATSAVEPAELDADDVHDDPGPTRTVPEAKVLDDIETAMALGRLDEKRPDPTPKASRSKKKR